MPGTYSIENRPKRPGAYFRFEAAEERIIPPAIGGIVAIPITHDWGPVEQATLVRSHAEFDQVFGDSITPGRNAVLQAFRGEDLDDTYGAGGVLVYRMTGTSGALATLQLQNTTPAPAVRLDSKYQGARANSLKVTVQDLASDPTKTEVIVYDGALEVERYQYADTDIAGFVSQVNLSSRWVTATMLIGTTALQNVASAAMTGGDSGTTLTVTDWTSALSALEIERFSLFAPMNLTDSAVVTSLKTWAINLNNSGRRFMVVLGGALNETVSDAVTRAQSLNSEHFVTVGVGSVRDDGLLDAAGNGTVLSTAALAPRIAGILAARGSALGATYARLAGLTILQGPTEGSILTAYDGGVIVLARDTDIEAPVHLETALTTYTTKTDNDKPYKVYSRPKYVRTMGAFETTLTEWAGRYIVGRTVVNNKTRDAVVGQARSILTSYEEAGGVQPGWTVTIPADASDDDEYIEIIVGMRFGRSAEQVFFRCRVG